MTYKFSITQLEFARHNASAFAKSLTRKDKERGGSYSSFSAWQNAIMRWHKFNDLEDSTSYLRTALDKFAFIRRNEHELVKFMLAFDAYIEKHISEQYVFMESRKRISIPIQPDLYVTGQVPIVNMNISGGYAIYFFSRNKDEWQDELRFPIMQHYFAKNVYGCDTSQIDVGIYSFNDRKHYRHCYTSKAIERAVAELSDIASKMNKALMK
jgi:hypothetical protein